MTVEIIYDIWQEVKRYIPVTDRNEAADILVNILIDNDYDANQILETCKNDTEIKNALTNFIDSDDVELDEEDDYDDTY